MHPILARMDAYTFILRAEVVKNKKVQLISKT